MDILKRIDQAQQFCKQYADGAWSIETDKWNYHVTPEFIEDIRQYIESLQLKLMHLQTQQAEYVPCYSKSIADMLEPQIVQSTNTGQPVLNRWYYTEVPPLLEEKEIVDLLGNCENGGWFKYHAFARAIETQVRKQFGVLGETK